MHPAISRVEVTVHHKAVNDTKQLAALTRLPKCQAKALASEAPLRRYISLTKVSVPQPSNSQHRPQERTPSYQNLTWRRFHDPASSCTSIGGGTSVRPVTKVCQMFTLLQSQVPGLRNSFFILSSRNTAVSMGSRWLYDGPIPSPKDRTIFDKPGKGH